jgi:hypothetical protein
VTDATGILEGQGGSPAKGTAVLEVAAADQDNGSGVQQMQISADIEFSDSAWQPYRSSVEIEAQPGQTIYVRVQDGSNNVSIPVEVIIPGAVQNTIEANHSVFLPLLEE